MLLHNSPDNLTEMLPVAGKTEAWALQHKLLDKSGSRLVKNNALETGEAHVHQQAPPFTPGTRLCLLAQGMPLVPCRCGETVILLLGICSPAVREKGSEPADNRP